MVTVKNRKFIRHCLMFGLAQLQSVCLISAVDPVATLAIFQALDVDPVLNMLVCRTCLSDWDVSHNIKRSKSVTVLCGWKIKVNPLVFEINLPE